MITKKRLIIVGSIIVMIFVVWWLSYIPPFRYLIPRGGIQYPYESSNELSECIHETALRCLLDLKCKLQETDIGFGVSTVSCCPRDESKTPEDNKCKKPFHSSDVVPSPDSFDTP